MARRRLRGPPVELARRGELVVERDPRRPSGRLLRQNGMDASYVDLAEPTHLEFDYLRWLRSVVIIARARRVLHIGGGACALARALAAEDPTTRQEVCELDAAVLELARGHMGLGRAPGLRVRHAEGREHLARLLPERGNPPGDAVDAVVVDAFLGARVPTALVSAQACAELAEAAPLALVNVVDDATPSMRAVDRVAAGLARAYPRVWTLGGRGGNTIVAGERCAPALELARIAAAAAGDRSPARLTAPAALARRIATVIPFIDAT